MSQSERADYDDTPFASQWARDPKILKRAGMFWLLAWGWLLGFHFIVWSAALSAEKVHINSIAQLIASTIAVILFLIGGYFVRKGRTLALCLVAVGSGLGVIIYGGVGVLIGISIADAYGPNPPTSSDKVWGAIVIGVAIGFLVWCFVAYFFTLRYALKKNPIAPPHEAN